MLKGCNSTDKFPLFTAVHRICKKELEPAELIQQIRNHPEHACVTTSDRGCGFFIPDRIKLKLIINLELNRSLHCEAVA
jgi:hypothetical protein